MASRNNSDGDGRVIVRNAQLREWLAETIVNRHVGLTHPDDDSPIPRRFGTLQHRWGFKIKKQGAWFPVTSCEVDKARLRAFRAGITFATYADFHLLRRNFEANPVAVRSGMWVRVMTDPPPCIPRTLALFWQQSGMSLIALANELDRMHPASAAEPDEMRLLIRSIIADMCRPLEPRRTDQNEHARVTVETASP